MNITRISALVLKETLQIIRDPSALLVAFVLPLILLFVFGYGINLDSNRVQMGIVLESQTPDTQELAKAFLRSPFIEGRLGYSREEFYGDLVAGRLRALVIIPQDFSLDEAVVKSLQVLTDGSEPNIASFASSYAQGVMRTWGEYHKEDRGQRRLKRSIEIESRFWYNPELKSRHFLVPGSIALIMTLIGTLLTALVIAREWERGTMEALMATPVSILDILLGKLVPYYILGMGSMALCTIISIYGFDVPFRGSLFALFVFSSLFLGVALGQGLMISSLAKDQFVAYQTALMFAFLPAFMLSGFIFEITSMPKGIQAVTYTVPARYFVNSILTVFLTGDVWPLFLKSMFGMLCVGAFFYLMIARKMKKRLDI